MYAQDPWSFFDVAMVLIFCICFYSLCRLILGGWVIARVLGLSQANWATTDFAYDVLSLEALFLVLNITTDESKVRFLERSLS